MPSWTVQTSGVTQRLRGVSAVSERVARDVRAIGPQEMTVLPNGIHVDAWRPVGSRTAADRVELISVMRLNVKKRPLKLVDMMRALLARLPASQRVRLRIVGDGPERRHVERAIARYGLSGEVELLGRRSRDEIRALLWSSDVFVLPTIRESFGIAALEARCAGLPVVAMRASGVAELIEHGREGLLADSDVDLVDWVAALVQDPTGRALIAEHNRSTAPPYDWSRVIEVHLTIYREAIALRDNARADT